MMKTISEAIRPDIRTAALVGHVHPDGDCIGSVIGTYHYLTENFPELQVTVYLESVVKSLEFLKRGIPVREDDGAGEKYDMVMSLDCSEEYRIGAGKAAFEENEYTVCIDHHRTNSGFACVNHVVPDGSSCAEVLTALFDEKKISAETAECLYTGIIHDTGVFRYDCVKPSTMRAAAMLIEKGIPFSKIIERTVTDTEFSEMQIMGEIFEQAVRYDNGTVVVGYASLELQKKYGVTPKDLGAVVSELNRARGCEMTIFLYQLEDGSWKGSLRSKDKIDVAEAAGAFGGGGHSKAAGFSIADGEQEAAVLKLREIVREQLKK